MQTAEFIGASPAAEAVREQIHLAARSDAKVLITGESGVGKEITALLIHAGSARSRMPLVAINCAGVPDSLLESELFGSVRGSFTDAHRDRAGLLAQANRGTLFMDEVGEMTLRMQGVLLRFLETGELQRVGSHGANTRVDVRLIAATNRDLVEAVAVRAFRADLQYRLSVIVLPIPPLRERIEDVPPLVDHFLKVFRRQYGNTNLEVAPEALSVLKAYSWPGNIRELKNVVERLVVRFRDDAIISASDVADVLHPRTDECASGLKSHTKIDAMFEAIVSSGYSFWSVVYGPFMSRDLTRDDVRDLVRKGLERTGGDYRRLGQMFKMDDTDYRRFVSFLRKHQCQHRIRPAGRAGLPA